MIGFRAHYFSQSQVISGKIVFETNFPMQPLLELPIFAAVEKQKL
jgi:hypothetical protein